MTTHSPSTPTVVQFATYASPLGAMTLAARANQLWGVWFNGQRHMPAMSDWLHVDSHPLLDETRNQLDAYFAGRSARFVLPLNTEQGTTFQRTVWNGLRSIPTGRTCSYADLARTIGNTAAVRAVGAAVGRNPWSIVVPCHRVVGADGSLTGYAGGLERKSALLQLEHAL